MPLEVELKFPLENRQALVARLVEQGASFQSPQREIDQYFQHPSRDFRLTDEAVRLRTIGDENRLTYKGPKLDAETKTRREIEFPLGSGSENRQLAMDWLEATDFTRVAVVSKTRVLGTLNWAAHSVTLSLDNVDNLGEYLELEVLAEPAEFEVAKAALLSLAASLGLQAPERRGYLHLLLDRGVAGT